MVDRADVVIVGGGPVGAMLALRLGGAGRDVAVVEPREVASGPLRPVALSAGSRLLLDRLDAWEALRPATAIRRIHVSQRGGFGRAMLTARDVNLPALGYVVDYAAMQAVLDGLLASRCCVRLLRAAVRDIVPQEDGTVVEYTGAGSSGAIQAPLIVVADGGATGAEARSRVVDYGQSAVVATVLAEERHPNTAFERFTSTGPLALLPWDDRYALVWSVLPERAQELSELAEAAFARELEREFGGRLGAFSQIGRRALFPLQLRVVEDEASPHVVRIGNAAQMLHPVAGQGLNLGLRDAWELADEVVKTGPSDAGSAAMKASFRARRRVDRKITITVTDALVRGFSNELSLLRSARGLGLTLLGCLPPMRGSVVRGMAFGFRP